MGSYIRQDRTLADLLTAWFSGFFPEYDFSGKKELGIKIVVKVNGKVLRSNDFNQIINFIDTDKKCLL